ncbi:MAG: hypothetical protein Q9182_002600 [Xanthomendoza sp. 2 TL-2023]
MPPPKPKVLRLGEIEHLPAQTAYNSLSTLADLITPESTNPADFLSECRSGAFDGTIAVYRTFQSVSITGRIEGEVVKALAAAGVRFIAHNGAGYDQIDVPACTTHSIQISNTAPAALHAATADTALFLLLGALRAFNPPLLSLRASHWRGVPPAPLGHDPNQKTLGILGMGGIGRNLAAKAAALGMNIIYHNRTRLPAHEEAALAAGAGVTYVPLTTLLRDSDALSLHLPLNPHTRHLISSPQLSQMKSSAVLINTARGAIVDESALVDALRTGTIAGCGLDVYEEEPAVHPGLVGDPRVVLLPHVGTWTVETQTAMEVWCVGNLQGVLEEGRLRSRVKEQEGM